MKKVPFRINQFVDPRKQGSELEFNKTFFGQLSPDGKAVYYTDIVGTDWVFFPGDTCTILPVWGLNKYNQTIVDFDLLQNSDGSQFIVEYDYDNNIWIGENKYENAFKLD